MKVRYVTYIFLAILGVSILFGHRAFAQTRLGLHVTQEELNIWKQRASTGPYKTTGDVSTNSPGDWTRINNNATTFRSNPAAQRWAGQPAGSCWSWQSASPAKPGRADGERMRDAAFRFLLMGDTADRDAVLTELLAQAATAGTNWADSVRWNVGSTCLFGDGHSWEISMWMAKLIYAYDYIRDSISAGNRTTLDTWFTNYATLMNANTHQQITSRFPNRDSDDYTTWGPGYPVCLTPWPLYFGGPTHCDFSEGWSNRSGNHVRVMALVGIMTNNSTFKLRAKRWFKEWVRFHIWPDGTQGEFYRAIVGGNRPGQGFHYASLAITTMATVADVFARSGDRELYDYSTSLGSPDGNLVPAGGPKSLLIAARKLADHVDHTLMRYGTSNVADTSNPNYLIDSIDEVFNEAYVHDTYMAQANLFWRDDRVKSIYLRQAAGAPAYPSNPAPFGPCVYCGEWGTLPGALFMFGQMEGKVNPYGGTTSAPPPSPTSTLALTADSTYAGYTTVPIDDGIINAAGGTATTWASADNATADHWIDVALPLPQQINTATIYWAYNSSQQKYMTSQRLDVQYWNGSSYVTAATITYPGFDIPSSTVSFPTITTSRIRFYQSANQGNPTYSGILWVTEVDYAFEHSPSAPSAFQVSVTP